MQTVDSAIGASNNAIGYGTAMGAVGYIQSSEFLGLAGLLIALLGLTVNVYFKRKANKRAEQIHALQVALLRRDPPLDYCKLPTADEEDT